MDQLQIELEAIADDELGCPCMQAYNEMRRDLQAAIVDLRSLKSDYQAELNPLNADIKSFSTEIKSISSELSAGYSEILAMLVELNTIKPPAPVVEQIKASWLRRIFTNHK